MLSSSREGLDQARIVADLQVALGRVVRRLRQGHIPGDLTLSESSVLSRLARHGSASPSELAADEHVRPQAMCTTLATLERQQLVTRASDPQDGRRAVISVTDAGQQLVLDRRGIRTERIARALAAGFTETEQRQLADATVLLERLADML